MPHEKVPTVYILTSRPHGTFYVGVTSDPWSRMAEHVNGEREGFTKRYNVRRLVYYEMHETMDSAIKREKLLKRWHRAWKVRIIEEMNPQWEPLFDVRTGELRDPPALHERLQGEPVAANEFRFRTIK